MQNARLDESQAGIKIARRNINNLRLADDSTTENEEELESLLIGWEECEHSKHEDHGIQSHHFMEIHMGKVKTVTDFYFLGFQNHCGQWLQPQLKDACFWKKSYDKPRLPIKKQRHHFANKGPSSQSYGFSSSYVWMWELDHKERSVPKNWCLQIVVLEKTGQSPGLQGGQTSQS